MDAVWRFAGHRERSFDRAEESDVVGLREHIDVEYHLCINIAWNMMQCALARTLNHSMGMHAVVLPFRTSMGKLTGTPLGVKMNIGT